MKNQKKFLMLAILVGIVGVGIGAITIFYNLFLKYVRVDN